MDPKTRNYLLIGGTTLVILLLVVVALSYSKDTSPVVPLGTALLAASAVTASAASKRQGATQQVSAAKDSLEDAAKEMARSEAALEAAMDAAEEDTPTQPRDVKERDAEKLFGA